VFLQLTDGVGQYTIVAEIHDLEEDTVLATSPPLLVEWSERLLRANVFLMVPPLFILHEGDYDLVVFANRQEVDRQKLSVLHEESD
jgi:hypothetical protein